MVLHPYSRLIALSLLALPVLAGAYGWKLMREALFTYFDPQLPFAWGQMLFGALLFFACVAFVGGYILHRDREKKRVQPRFQKGERRR